MRPALSLVIAIAAIASSVASATSSPISPSTDREFSRHLGPVAARGMMLQKRHTTKATYYAGNQLDNPACGGATPSDNSMVAAVSEHGPFKCGDKIKLTKNGKSVTVTVVDKCASCGAHHVDLTKGAFAKLGSLSQGVIHHIQYDV